VDPSFNTGAGPSGSVNAIAIQADRRILIGGSFTAFAGIPQTNIARLNTDGSLDGTFIPPVGSPLSSQSSVLSIALQPDSRLLIAGRTTPVGGGFIVRLNSDGSLDQSFQSGTFNGEIDSITVRTNGEVLVSGLFTAISSIPKSGLAQLNTNGVLDTAFNPAITSYGHPRIHSVVLQPDSKLVIGGVFSTVGGASRTNIARLEANGGLDFAFDPGSGTSGLNNGVYSVAVQDDGKVIICGQFSAVNGATRLGIARLNSNGSLDSPFDLPFGYYCVAIEPTSSVIVGSTRVARLTPSGGLTRAASSTSGRAKSKFLCAAFNL